MFNVDVKTSWKPQATPQARLFKADYKRLGEFAEDVAVESNRGSVLAGLDKDGNSMPPVTYRPKRGQVRQHKRFSMRARGRTFGTTRHAMQGTAGDNLTTAEYQQLTGPPLAPRFSNSRVITNFVTKSTVWGNQHGGGFTLEFGWADVVSRKGFPFLIAHFEGGADYPRRDLRGLQPAAVKLIDRTVLTAIAKGVDEALRV